MPLKSFILFLSILFTPLSAQITWVNALGIGTVCLPTITATELTFACTGKGFYVFDPLVMGYTTTMTFKASVDAGQTFGIGLGQQTNSNCQSSNFPTTGQTLASCTPSTSYCKKTTCMFDKATVYSSNTLSNLLLPDPITSNKHYTWQFIPPTCPVSGKAWQIQISSSDDSSFSSRTLNSLFLGPPDYNYDCSGTNVYAVYFELETNFGGVTVSITAPGCAAISNCLSCPDPAKCQYCQPGFTVSGDSSSCECINGLRNLAGDGCTTQCPLRSSPNAVQCICDYGYQLSADKTSCECQTGYLDIPQSSCVATCPALTSPSGKACQCNSPFLSDGTYCICSGSNLVNLKGDACTSACPPRSIVSNGQCVCDFTSNFQLSSDGTMCKCSAGFLTPDGGSCVVTCPNHSTEDQNDVCQCQNGFSGSDCNTCAAYLSVDGNSCVNACPARSTLGSGNVCSCLGGYYPNGNTCICWPGYLVDLDGISCASNCMTGASDSNGDGICECDNGLSGVFCDTCPGLWWIDGSCVSKCPDRSYEDSGSCVCDFPPYVAGAHDCVCVGTDLVDIDGKSCVPECSEHASDGDGDGICECDSPFVLTGSVCGCSNGAKISIDGSTCLANCPSNSSPVNGKCECDGSYLINGATCSQTCDGLDIISLDGTTCINPCPEYSSNSGGQCICDGSLFISADGKNCVCPGASDKINVDGETCISSCPLHSSLSNGQCVCDTGFVVKNQGCTCDLGLMLSISGDGCVSFCPQGSSVNSNRQCECKTAFDPSGNSCVCPNSGDKINIDVSACISQCPPYSFESSGKCFCNGGFQTNGDKCACATGQVVNLAGTGCIATCPQYSSVVDGACVCGTGFTKSGDGNSCQCAAGKYISIDGTSCGSSCSAHSSAVFGHCTCNNNFVKVGNNCQCDTGKILNTIGDYCIDSCPDGAFENSGQCQCYGAFAPSGSACICSPSDPIMSVDGTYCTSLCPAFSSDDGLQCVCDGTLVRNGDACGCPNGNKINLAGTGCVGSCPTHSSEQVGGQCQCDAPWVIEVVNQASCICPSTLHLSLDGLNCMIPCPENSIIVNNACVCDSSLNFVLSADKQSCECQAGTVYDPSLKRCLVACSGLSPPNNVYPNCYQCDGTCKTCSGPNSNQCLSCNSGMTLDFGSCLPACPTLSPPNNVYPYCYSCDGKCQTCSGPNPNQCLSCNSGMILDSGICLVACPSLNPPNNFPPYCYPCDKTCKTCSGPNSNQCLTCFSGYQVSTANTCNAIVQTPTTTSVEVAKTTKKLSSTSLAASSVASVGNSGAMRLSLVGNMFQYLKFMNISYSEQLGNMLENLNSQFLPFTIDVEIPSAMTDESNYKPLPYQFTKYEGIHPSFLMNFWDDLSVLVLVIGIVGVLIGLQFVLNKFSNKKKTVWKVVFSKASLMTQSFLLTYTYNDLGGVIFYGLLDFKSAKSYSGVHVFNLIIAVLLLLAEFGLLTAHYILLMKYQKIKRARSGAGELEEFLEKHENLKAFFEDFNDFSFLQQCFLLVAIFRDMLSNLILVTLYEYPLAESTCLMVFSILMIVYILYSGPFKEILNAIQQILCEGILLLVNCCVFINAVMDHINSNDNELRRKLGSIVVVSNSVFNFVPMAFLAIALWQISKELYAYLQRWINRRKITNMAKKEELNLKSEVSDNSKMILQGLSFEGGGPVFTGVVEENKNETSVIQMQHKLTEDLELSGLSQDQNSRMMSKDNSRIFEINGDQGKDELILEENNEKRINWSKKNGLRKVKIKRRAFPPPQLNGLSVEDVLGDDGKL